MMMRKRRKTLEKGTSPKTSEKGSALFYILLAVVLFGALSFTVARGMRGSQTSTLSSRKAALAASGILDYAQKIQRAIDQVRRKGCSENNISMETPDGLNINPTAPINKSCHIFSPLGGNVTWSIPQDGVGDNSFWRASSHSNVQNIGTAKADLLLYLPSIDKTVCEKINKSANIIRDTIPLENGFSFQPDWSGSFNDGGPHVISCDGVAPMGACTNKPFACIDSDVANIYHDKYIFYYVLIER
ncbi:MAG: hypothetical protein COA45_06860 [Zetaproteobacteria bacterium]|nr:MAG: hypothetical protein COA45_06860 [Zetaproteobacteria bacterium]